MPLSLRLLTWVTLVSTAVCGLVHLSTFFGFAFYSVIFFVPLLFIVWPMVVWQWRRVPRGNLVSQVFGGVPRSLKWTASLLLFYVFLNYGLCRAINEGGMPMQLPDKRLVLQAGELVLRVLTPDQYAHAQAVQVRQLSGHLVAFYGLALIALKAFWLKTGPAMADSEVSGK